MPSTRTIALVVMLALLCCAQCIQIGCEARGRMERVSPHLLAPQPPEIVELYLDDRQPDRPYHVVARVESQASTRRFVTLHEAEAAALDKLRDLAARAGALAVIDIEQTVMIDEERGEQIIHARGKAIAYRR
jgi:hypothetical protein